MANANHLGRNESRCGRRPTNNLGTIQYPETTTTACTTNSQRQAWKADRRTMSRSRAMARMAPDSLQRQHNDRKRAGRQHGKIRRQEVGQHTRHHHRIHPLNGRPGKLVCQNEKKGKAPGEDCIPSTIMSACPQAMAKALHPLIMKSTVWGSEPQAWRGGQLHELFKGKGTRAEACNYRGVFHMSSAGNLLHRWSTA